MKTSCKKGENLLQMNQNNNINVTPFTPRKQLNFTSQKPRKYDISCSQREQDRENLKNNLLLTYIESQNCPNPKQNTLLNFSSNKKKSPMILNKFKNQFSKKYNNELIVSIYIKFNGIFKNNSIKIIGR